MGADFRRSRSTGQALDRAPEPLERERKHPPTHQRMDHFRRRRVGPRVLVERIPDPEDKRAKLVRLTPRGQDVQAAAFKTFAEIEAEWGERIGKKKVAALRAALEELSLLPPLVLPRAA